MKKLFALVLTVVMLAAMAVSASAATYPLEGENFIFQDGTATGIELSENRVIMSEDSYASHWASAQLLANDDVKDGFTVKITDIEWDEDQNNAVTIVYGNGTAPSLAFIDSYTSNFVLLVMKDGSIVFWGNGYRGDMTYGLWVGVKVTDVSLGESVTEFTYSMVPNADNTVYTFYVNDIVLFEYDIEVENAIDENGHYASVINNPHNHPCNFGFMVLDGTYDAEKEGWGRMPTGTLAYTIAEVDSVGIAPANPVKPGQSGEQAGDQSDDTTRPLPVIGKPTDNTTVAPGTTAGAPTTEADNTNLIIIIAASAAAVVAIAVVVIIVVAKSKKAKKDKE